MSELNHHRRILQIITLFSVGGATETVVSLAKGLETQGFDVTVVAGPHIPFDGDMLPIARAAGINVIILKELTRNIHPFNDLRALIHLTRIIKRGQFDIVHTHSSKAGVLGRMAAYIAGVRKIVHTVHGLPFHKHQNLITRYFYVIVEKFVARFTSLIIAVSRRMVTDYIEAGVGRKDQFVVIRSGINTELFEEHPKQDLDLRRRLGIQTGDFVIGKISRLSPLKGHSTVIKLLPAILEEFPHVKVLFVGDGEIREELIADVENKGLREHVIFAGLVVPSEIPRYLSIMDLVVHTSLHEGGPRVLPQALLMGKPVISYDVGLAPEVVRDGFNGFIVATSEDSQLVNAIRQTIERYDFFAENSLRDSGRMKEEFSEEKMVLDMCNAYARLLNTTTNDAKTSKRTVSAFLC